MKSSHRRWADNDRTNFSFFIGIGAHRDAATGTSLARKTGKLVGRGFPLCSFAWALIETPLQAVQLRHCSGVSVTADVGEEGVSAFSLAWALIETPLQAVQLRVVRLACQDVGRWFRFCRS